MTGLVIRLAPRERVLLNGAVIENGDKRASLSIQTPNAKVLRLRDAIHPDEATTPVKRTCYMAQLLLSGDAKVEDLHTPLLRAIEQLSQVFLDPDSDRLLKDATEAAVGFEFYQALKSLRALLPREARLLAAHRV
ncbi:flagellum biosynthesis repressor protein FlbT [Roseibaca ekhonensis]|jgi:flagellar protein FlbT|uniref:Flagellum biosynthesis repressor protein FlbT n=1 Tax=Roseinatronobacter ekhonensis TaxID=254356 RepID=A0A3B0MTK2_9RHOB|nr:flagellar biosynthesis repressor FlbT [Roseibaca ekhonensis]SUZ32154.1 flagellum biosynthesis repressor protein FlbT [Roseibaca ekhonensis]